MQNPRETRQADYHHLMSLYRTYLRLARSWHRSVKYSLDERYSMCRAADAMAEKMKEAAAVLWDS